MHMLKLSYVLFVLLLLFLFSQIRIRLICIASATLGSLTKICRKLSANFFVNYYLCAGVSVPVSA